MKRLAHWLFRIFLGLAVLILCYGTIKQYSYDTKVEKKYPPVGEFSDIGHNKIHFRETGSGALTFVMIAGLGETMSTWHKIEKELQDRGHVFLYDRSGLGHSEEGILPRSVDNSAIELHMVLENENIKGPYILVGHSAGGFIARYYAKKYPKNVMGLFLIDPYNGDVGQDDGHAPSLSFKLMNWSFRNLSWSGIPYFLLSKPPHPIYKTSKAIKTYGQEAFSEKISLQEFKKLDNEPSAMPLYLITADMKHSLYNDSNKKWHKEVFAKYSNKINEHLVIESGHHIHIEKPQQVLKALDDFLDNLTPTND